MDLVPAPAVRLMKSGSEENYSMRSEFLSIFSSPFYDNSLFFFFANLLFHYLLKIILQISFFHGFAVLFLSLKKLVLSSAFSISGAASFVSKKERDNIQDQEFRELAVEDSIINSLSIASASLGLGFILSSTSSSMLLS